MAKNRHILHAAARNGGNSLRAAALIAALAVLIGATAVVQPAQAQTDDHGNTIAEATPVELGGMQTGEINPGDDEDYFVFVVAATTTLTIHTTGNLDTLGTVEDSDGTILRDSNDDILENDDIDTPTNRNFRIAPDRQFSPGTYYINVTSYSTLVGFYTVHINFAGSRAVSIEPRINYVLPGTAQTLTLQVSSLPLPATARLTITTGGEEGDAGNITAPATVTIPAGMISANFDITLDAGATEGNTGTVSLSDAVFIHADDMGITRTTDTLVIGGELFVLNIDITANVFTLIVGDPSALVNICDRTPEVVTNILADSDVTETNCAVVPQAQLNDVTELRLANLPSATTTLRSDDFANLPHLELLNLSSNHLDSLPANVFDGLISLRRLLMNTNTLGLSLPAGLFDGLSALWMLNLRGNYSLLPAGLFNDVLDTLAELLLNNNDLTTTISIEPRTATIAPDGIQTLTAQLTAPSPVAVRLTITAGGAEASHVTLPDPATVTIPAGMMSATFDITLAADATAGNTGTVSLSAPVLPYTDTTGEERRNISIVNTLVNTLNTADNTHTFTTTDPSATYALTTPHAFEPTSNGAGDEVEAVFTLTLSNLNQAQSNADMRRFFFGFISGFSGSTPGYAPLDESIADLTIARRNSLSNDFQFSLEYVDMNGENATETFNQNTNQILRAQRNSGEEVYTFRLVPQYNLVDGTGAPVAIDEGVESFPFGYRVVFIGAGSENWLTGMVNGGEGDPVPTISDPLVATFTRSDTPTEEGDSPTPATFTLMLENAPSGPAVVTYTLEVSGTTPANGDISAAFDSNITGTPAISGDGSDTFTINVNITLSSDDTAATLDITPVSDGDMDDEIVTLTIASIEVAGLSLGPSNLVCPELCPDGALSITVRDDDKPTAMLTRDRDSIEEGVSTPGVFTLALNNAPDGPAIVTYTLAVTGGNISDDNISATLSGAVTDTPVIDDTVLTATVINSSASISISITPIYDEDKDNELVTLTISQIEFAGITLSASDIQCSACSNDGELSITLVDVPNAEVTYALTDPYAFEPAADGTNAGAGAFTITLSNLDANGPLNGSPLHRFTFRLEPDDAGATPGYGSIDAADPADTDDFNLFVEYMDSGGVRRELPSTIAGVNGYTFPPFNRAKRINGEQTYTFHVVPTRNDDGNRLMERVVFGLHVFFTSSNSQFTTGVVNNSGTAPAVTIFEAPVVTLTRDAPFTTEDGSDAAFRLDLAPAPGGVATVTYTLEVTGQNADAADINAMFFGADPMGLPVTDGTISTFTMRADIDARSTRNLSISPQQDGDRTNETVTLTIIRVEIDDITLGPDNLECPESCPGGALSITIRDDDGPGVSLSRTSISEASLQTTAEVSIDTSSIPANPGTGTISVSIPQGDMDPVLDLDYTYQYQVGGLNAVAADNPNLSITIPPGQAGNNIVFTFTPINDNYEEGEEPITINFGDLMFPEASPEALTLAPFPSAVTIRIEDDDDAGAALNKGRIAVERLGAPISSTFALAITQAPDATARVTYTLGGGLGTKYTADLEGAGSGESLIAVANSVFTIPKGNITGTNPGIQGGAQGAAEVTITINPQNDDDDDHENVTLTIHSITFDNGSQVGDLAAGDLTGDGISNGAQTLAIRDAFPVDLSLIDPDAFEPLSAETAADPATFQITLNNLNTDQRASGNRRFFFRFAPNFGGSMSGLNRTPGYGTLPPGIISAAPFEETPPHEVLDFTLWYQMSDNSLLEFERVGNTYASDNINVNDISVRNPGSSTETHIFRIVPLHDGIDEPTEHVVFGYRVFFTPPADTDANQFRGVVDGSETAPAATIADGPSVTLTRDSDSINEDAQTPGTFTLALTDFGTGSGFTDITYIIKVTGDTPDDNDISTSFTVGTTTTFSMPVVDGSATASIAITPVEDADMDDETVTLTIIRVVAVGTTFESDDIACTACSPAGALDIIITDTTVPEAIITPDGVLAIEPTSATANDAVEATFTIRLINLTTPAQTVDAAARGFFFNSGGSDFISMSNPHTNVAGHGDPAGITAANWDNDFTLEYVPEDGSTPTAFEQGGGPGIYRNSGTNIFKTPSETYTFRVTPTHDNNEEGVEHVLFGYRVFFSTLGENQVQIRGIVNTMDSSVAIADELPPTLTPVANYGSAVIELTEGSVTAASAERTLTLTNAPNHAATVRFTFAGGTAHVVGDAGVADPDIAFSVSGGENLVINAIGTGGTFTIPAGTTGTAEAVLTFTASDSTDSTGERIAFTVTGIVFDDGTDDTNIPELPELTINITDPTPGSLAISVGNPNLEIGDVTTVTLALTNIPTRVSGVEVDRIEFKFRNFPVQTAFGRDSGNPTPGDPTQLTFDDPLDGTGAGYDLTISENILGWRIRTIGDTTMGELTINVSPAALTGEAADITLRVTANAVSMLTATNRPVRVYDSSSSNLGHPIAITGIFGFTIMDNAPATADISIDHDDGNEDDGDTTTILENEDIVVTVILDQPLPEDGTVHYIILPRAGSTSSIEAHDVTGGFITSSTAPANQGETTIKFTVNVADDNRIDAAELEEGTIGIVRVEWGGDGDLLAVNTSVDFTITDNDGITLRLDAAEYEVRDNADTLMVTVTAEANPIPSTHNEVILDRPVTADFATAAGVGVNGAVPPGDYLSVASGSGLAPALSFTGNLNLVTYDYDIGIANDGDNTNETFTVTLSSNSSAVDIATPEATVTIVPNTTGDYGTASTTVALTENDGMSVERILSLRHAPNSEATVSFELTGVTDALVFTVGGGATGLMIDDDNMGGSFTVSAGGTTTLAFEAAADFYGDDETITFSITRITFADGIDVTNVTDSIPGSLPPNLNIGITDVGPTAEVTAVGGDTAISELALDDSAVIRVTLTNIPSAATNAVIGFGLTGATLDTDYTVTLAGSSTAANSVTITEADIDGSEAGVPQGGAPGSAEATLTFLALNDSEAETETIELTINNVMFAGVSGRDLTPGAGITNNSQSITIADRPTDPFARISVRENSITEGDGLSEMLDFRITFSNIASSTGTGTVNYRFNIGFSPAASVGECNAGAYCAFSRIFGTPMGLISPTGNFTFAASSISNDVAEIGFSILPREDGDAEDETVELTIDSITVPQSGAETLIFDLTRGNLVDSAGTSTNTALITIRDNAIRLRIRTFLEGALQ